MNNEKRPIHQLRFQHDNQESLDDETDQLYENEMILDEREFENSSQASSSPPKDFNVNIEDQYVPLFGENDDDAHDGHHLEQRSSSLASSLSIESDHDYATSPVILTANTSRIIRCPACDKPMRTFYCAVCIQKGKFITLDQQINDKESPKCPIREQPDTATTYIDEAKALEDMLRIRMRTLSRKTETLQTLYQAQKVKLEETKRILNETRQQVEMEKKSHRSKESKIELIKRYITSRKASVKKRHNAEAECVDEVKQHVSRRVYQLIQDVFPIEEINLLEQNSSFINMETSPLLTFSDGSHHQIEHQTAHTIVEPWLPSDGDYSAYSLWINDNKEQIPAPVDDYLYERNPAFRIGAGLAYTTQLVKNLASYLDVILPARIELDMFGRELLDDSQFSYNVAKLNNNVLHLCLSQGIDISLLNPTKTLKNLMLLFNVNVCELGRTPLIELDSNEEVAQRIEEGLSKDLSLIRESFYDFSKFDVDDEDSMSDSEWEISDNISATEIQNTINNQSITQQSSYISGLPMRLIASFINKCATK